MAALLHLTKLEEQTLLAIIRLHPNAYGVPIREEIKQRTGKEPSVGSIYAVLEKLEDNGLILSREGEATAARGGRRKLYFTITGLGRKTLEASLRGTDALRSGLGIGEALA